jgi:predicted nuclease of predicted toxin-antitoxin system
VKLLLDENLSHRHAAFLREQGHDAVAVVEVGLSGQPDSGVRMFAIESGRILLTLDADFANILRFPPAGTPGVTRLKIHPPTEDAIASRFKKRCTLIATHRSLAAWPFRTEESFVFAANS